MNRFKVGDKVTLKEDYLDTYSGLNICSNVGTIATTDGCLCLVDCGDESFWFDYPQLIHVAPLKKEGLCVYEQEKPSQTSQWTDKHYDFNYSLTQADIERGSIKLDPYFVYGQWGLHKVDKYGVLFHQFKTLSRFGRKNDIMREIDALIGQATRLKQLVENENNE